MQKQEESGLIRVKNPLLGQKKKYIDPHEFLLKVVFFMFLGPNPTAYLQTFQLGRLSLLWIKLR